MIVENSMYCIISFIGNYIFKYIYFVYIFICVYIRREREKRKRKKRELRKNDKMIYKKINKIK